MEKVDNPANWPDAGMIAKVEEPYVKARITCPSDYIGAVMKLGQERRGEYIGMDYLDPTRVQFEWNFPLAEIILEELRVFLLV